MEQELTTLCASHIAEQMEYRIVPAFSSAKEVLEFLTHDTIDILFLDIEMPEMDGFTLAKQLRETYPEMLLIFVSSYEERVYDSFSYNPFWFLRKSRIKQEIAQVFLKAMDRYLSATETMTFQTKEGEVLLLLKDILYLEAEHNYYKIDCINGASYKCRGALSAVEEALQEHDFYRVHAAYLINMAHVQQIQATNMIVMKDGRQIPVSRHRLVAFKSAYATFTRKRILP